MKYTIVSFTSPATLPHKWIEKACSNQSKGNKTKYNSSMVITWVAPSPSSGTSHSNRTNDKDELIFLQLATHVCLNDTNSTNSFFTQKQLWDKQVRNCDCTYWLHKVDRIPGWVGVKFIAVNQNGVNVDGLKTVPRKILWHCCFHCSHLNAKVQDKGYSLLKVWH